MTAPISWPTALLPPHSILFARQTKSASGGQSVSGNEQVVASSADRWRARLTTRITNARQALAYRGLMALADGRAGLWLIPPCAGKPAIGGPVVLRATFSDASTFSDLSEFASTFVNNLLQATVTAAAARGARSLNASAGATSPPVAGHYFSIGERLYVVAAVTPLGGNAFTIAFRPGLRDPVALGAVLNFSSPACRMRLASDDTGDMDLELLRFSTINLEFVEAA